MKERLPFHLKNTSNTCGLNKSEDHEGPTGGSSGSVAPLKGNGRYRIELLARVYAATEQNQIPIPYRTLMSLPGFNRSEKYKLNGALLIKKETINGISGWMLSDTAAKKAETYLYSPDGMNEIIAPIFLEFGRALGDIIVKIISHVKPRQNRPRNP